MGRTPCCDKNGLKKGPWTVEEDQKLMDYIHEHGCGSWRTLPKNAGLSRCGKSCRLRWTNYLRPDIKRGRFSFEEEETIIQLHSVLGNKWSSIAARLPGRTDNEIKNYWNTHIRKRLFRMGINPVTHGPRLDLLDLSSLLGQSLYNPVHFDGSRFLGIDPLMNSELLRIATTLLSAQRHNTDDFLQQSIQEEEQQFPNSQSQQPFIPSFQANQFQNPVQEIPDYTTSADQAFLSQTQQPNVVQLQSTSETNLLQGNDHNMRCNFSENLVMPLNTGYCSYAQSIADMLSSKNPSSRQILMENFNIPTPMNSSSTYINSSTEDERDSNCSNELDFQIPDLLDFSDFSLM